MNETTSDYISELKARLEAAERERDLANRFREELAARHRRVSDVCNEYHAASLRLKERVTELEKQLADAKLPTVEHIQDIYELSKLKEQLAALTAVYHAASKGQDDFKNYYPERGLSADASDYDSRAERLKKNIAALEEALTAARKVVEI